MTPRFHAIAAAFVLSGLTAAHAQDSTPPHPWDGIGLPAKLYTGNDAGSVAFSGISLFDDKQRAVLVKRLQNDGNMRANCPSVESVDVLPKPASVTTPSKDYDTHLGNIATVSQELWTVKQCGFRRYYVVARQVRAGDRQTYHMTPLLADPMRPALVVLAATDTAPAVLESQVRDEYERWTTLTTATGTEYNVRHILCKTQPEAQTAIDRIKAGESFAKVAGELSIDKGSSAKGGELGWSPTSVFVQEFGDAMKGLGSKGMVTAPVYTQFGWHVIEVLDVRQPVTPPYSELKERLAQLLRKRSLAGGRPPAS